MPGLHCKPTFSSTLGYFEEQVPEIRLERRRGPEVRKKELFRQV